MNTTALTVFSVTPEGVILMPDVSEPRFRSEVFERIDPDDVHTCEDLIRLIKACPPLTDRFRQLAQDHLAAQSSSPDAAQPVRSPVLRTGHQQLLIRSLRQNRQEGWRQWIALSGEGALEGYLQHVRDWLDEDIDWREREYFDSLWNAQTAAFGYFADLPVRVLKALGIRIVGGDVPGSSDCAAHLRGDIGQANRLAQSLDQTFRFEPSALIHQEVCHG